MAEAAEDFQLAIQDLSTAKDKVLEISDVMMRHQHHHASLLVDTWCTHFKKVTHPQKKLALLFVMNDVLNKSVFNLAKTYLGEFARVLVDVIEHLYVEKLKELLLEFDKVVVLWQRSSPLIYAEDFTVEILNRINQAIDQLHAEETGARVIQEFYVTQHLAQLESLSENLLAQAKSEDSYFQTTPQDLTAARNMLLHHKRSAEDLLLMRSQVILELAALLEVQYKLIKQAES